MNVKCTECSGSNRLFSLSYFLSGKNNPKYSLTENYRSFLHILWEQLVCVSGFAFGKFLLDSKFLGASFHLFMFFEVFKHVKASHVTTAIYLNKNVHIRSSTRDIIHQKFSSL